MVDWQAILSKHRAGMWRSVYRLLRNYDDSLECCQDATGIPKRKDHKRCCGTIVGGNHPLVIDARIVQLEREPLASVGSPLQMVCGGVRQHHGLICSRIRENSDFATRFGGVTTSATERTAHFQH